MEGMNYRLTYEESIEALKNEYRDLKETYDPSKVIITNETAPEGNLCLLKFIVKAPSYYLEAENDTNPKPTSEMTFYVQVPNGYPKVKPSVYYAKGRRLASVNVFRNGYQCIDDWKPSSSIEGTVRKTIMDIIHDPIVTRYDSMANSSLEKWQRQKTEEGILPTFSFGKLLVKSQSVTPELPTRLVTNPVVGVSAAPPLPTRN